MEIFIHIGPHKTGTTTIQSGLWLNQIALQNAGIFLPQTGTDFNGAIAHHDLAWALNKRKGLTRGKEKLWIDLSNEIRAASQFPKVIISSEEFCVLNSEEISVIKKSLAGQQVHIVAYLRRQDKLLQSIWTQMVKNPKNLYRKSFYQFINKFSSEIHPINYERMIKNWAGVFGKENLLLNVLEKGSLKGHLFADFLSQCGLENYQEFSVPQDLNQSPDLKTLSIFYKLKKYWLGKKDPKMMGFIFDTINDFARESGWDLLPLGLIGPGMVKNIMDLYAPSNQEIAQKYFSRGQLFKEAFEAEPRIKIGEENLTDDEWATLLTRTPLRFFLNKKAAGSILSTSGNDRYMRFIRTISPAGNPLKKAQNKLILLFLKLYRYVSKKMNNQIQ